MLRVVKSNKPEPEEHGEDTSMLREATVEELIIWAYAKGVSDQNKDSDAAVAEYRKKKGKIILKT